MSTQPQPTLCAYCNHATHPRGQKCGAPITKGDKTKACKCKAGAHWFDGLGNAIGESLFGGNR